MKKIQGFASFSCITGEEYSERKSIILTQDEITKLYYDHADTVYRVCFTYMRGSRYDLEDAVQSAFLTLVRANKRFSSDEHAKAWLIVTASNICRNMLKRAYRSDEEFDEGKHDSQQERDETLEAVLEMPENERVSVYLHYYEGYTAKEIGDMLAKTESTVWGYLHKGRSMLRSMLKEES